MIDRAMLLELQKMNKSLRRIAEALERRNDAEDKREGSCGADGCD